MLNLLQFSQNIRFLLHKNFEILKCAIFLAWKNMREEGVQMRHFGANAPSLETLDWRRKWLLRVVCFVKDASAPAQAFPCWCFYGGCAIAHSRQKKIQNPFKRQRAGPTETDRQTAFSNNQERIPVRKGNSSKHLCHLEKKFPHFSEPFHSVANRAFLMPFLEKLAFFETWGIFLC